ncbi:ATP-binding protein [Argonema antarcticum]|uniref:ATP-binding protein n=1 Tax=Argonema antarcticum TaxID=2942763 RepID=UPI002011787B|nr:ATP-binding protein [Argonema antarcticum]MCL1476018.1 hypothetical protein [Argonema antarcticum A004/B2]
MPEDLRNEEIIKHIRYRPAMYFGSVGTRGVEQFVYELVSNVLDTYLANQATFVNVKLDGTTISVVDDGPGLPFDKPSDLERISLATKFLTHVHQIRSQDEHAPHVHMTTLGLGIAPLNVASVQLTVQSWRSGVLWEQHFARGVPESSATVVEQGNGRGTRIEVIPDPEIFGQAKPRLGVIRRSLFEAAHLFSGLRIGFDEERFYAPTGLQMLGFMLLDSLSVSTNPNTLPFHVSLRYENVFIEAAIFGEKRSPTRTFSWVNGARTPDGGSHVKGLFQVLKEVGWKPALSLIHVVMFEPEFAGPMRTKLDVPHIGEVMKNALREPLHQYRRQFI